jgi:hypothetical protein
MERDRKNTRPPESLAFSRATLVRSREIAAALSWDDDPEVKVAAAKLLEAIDTTEALFAEWQALLVYNRMNEMLARLPSWLALSPKETGRVEKSVGAVLRDFPAATWSELLWCLVVGSIRPPTRGRKAKWSGVEGLLLVAEVDAVLKAKGWKRSNKKGLERAIAIVHKSPPRQRYGKYSEQALRSAYYVALPNHTAARAAIAELQTQSGNSAEYPDPISLERL